MKTRRTTSRRSHAPAPLRRKRSKKPFLTIPKILIATALITFFHFFILPVIVPDQAHAETDIATSTYSTVQVGDKQIAFDDFCAQAKKDHHTAGIPMSGDLLLYCGK